MHHNQAIMVLKNGDNSGESFGAVNAKEDSCWEGNGPPPSNDRGSIQGGASQPSTLLNINASYNVSSENAESSMEARTSCDSFASEEIEMRGKLSSRETSVENQQVSGPSLVSDTRKSQKGSGHSDGSMSNKRANDSTEVLSSGSDKDRKGVSFGPGAINNSGEGVESVDSQTTLGSPSLHCDTEDRNTESRKHSLLMEDIVHKLSSSSATYKCHNEDEKFIKSNKAAESDEVHEPALQTSVEDDVDGSDVEEEDVKVCDICGDAGREDLLAVCSRCSDGAEHTYCMREMLDKVPEGDWLCEECKFNELEARKQEHPKMLGSSEREKYLGRTNLNSDTTSKFDIKDPLSERSKVKNISVNKPLPSKRSGDSMEAGPTAKKQALEPHVGLPTTSSPSRMPVLSKDTPFKNLDKTKGKQTQLTTAGNEPTGDFSEDAHSPTTSSVHILKGNLVKSNSFSFSNSKLNVKVSDEVSQKQKQGLDMKDSPGKSIGKSMSFKGLGRSSASEPKVRMLPQKSSPVQELKGQKQGRDRNSFERKTAIKLDHPIPTHMVANASKRPSRGDNVSTLSVSNGRDYKTAQSDGKLTTSLKNACHSVHKSSDAMGSVGEVKKQPSTSIGGSAPVNGTCSSVEAKPSQVSLKDRPTQISSRSADRSLVGANIGKADVVDNQNEKAPENSFGRSRHGLLSAMVSGNRRGLSLDVPIPRTKEGMHEENKLKAAIEAAMQKKQDIFKKNRIPEKPNEFSRSNTQEHQVGHAFPNHARDATSQEVMHEGDAVIHNHVSNSCKLTSINSTKQFNIYPADFVFSPIGEAVLTLSASPEQESVWHGGFEIHRSGKLADMCGGIQAHLSSFASGKVLEVVKRFPQKIILNEVARSSAWPMQFKDIGAREDNIALYFFAKDLESYIRGYKILLEYMMKHDLGLKGNINGVELLIFPSNHLPDKSQCWNTLFFMWGVFRGRRPHGPDNRSGSPERPEISISKMTLLDKGVTSTACLSEKPCLHPAVQHLTVSDSHSVLSGDEDFSPRSCLQQSADLSNGDCYDQGYSVAGTCLSSQASTECPEKRPENQSPGLGAEACRVSRMIAAVEHHYSQQPKLVTEHQKSTKEIGKDLYEAKKSLSDLMLDKQDDSSHSSEAPLVNEQEGCSVVSLEEQQVLDTVGEHIYATSNNSLKQERCGNNTKNIGGQVKFEKDVKQDEEDMDSILENDKDKFKLDGAYKQVEGYVDINISADSNIEDLHCLHMSPKRSLHVDATESSQGASVITCQKRQWMDAKDTSEDGEQASTTRIKQGGGSSVYGCNLHRLPNSSIDGFAAQFHGVSTSSHMEDTSDEADKKKSISANPGSAEGYFFLVESHPAKSVHSIDDSFSWKLALPENEDRLPDGSPNLELALGVEKKQARKGVLPFFAGIVDRKDPDRPPDIETGKEEEDEDASASLSLSLAFPFSDKERSSRPERSPTNVEQALPGRHEVSTSLLLFRGSSGK